MNRGTGPNPTNGAGRLGLDRAERLALDVADAEALIWRGIVEPTGTTSVPVSPSLHAEVLLILAERDRDSALHQAGLTLAEALAVARALAVLVQKMRRETAFNTATLPPPDDDANDDGPATFLPGDRVRITGNRSGAGKVGRVRRSARGWVHVATDFGQRVLIVAADDLVPEDDR